jgi:hypothetical protein
MSIIVTQISKYGIVFGADSNITNDTEVVKEDIKIFEIPKLKAMMCTAGAYSVNGEILSKWLPLFIENKKEQYSNLGEFTEILKEELEKKMSTTEKKNLFITHIAGYENGHPEMWHISNTRLENGEYTEGQEEFHLSEDLWNRDWKKNNLENIFESDGLNYQLYVNGFTPGRIAFNVIRPFIDRFFITMWQQQGFKFRPPKNIKEQEEIVKIYIQIINSLFEISNYDPKIIGGNVKTFSISKP